MDQTIKLLQTELHDDMSCTELGPATATTDEGINKFPAQQHDQPKAEASNKDDEKAKR